MILNKLIIQNNVDIIRKMNFEQRNKLDKQAFENFKVFLKQVPKKSKLVFIFNSLDEIDIYEWVVYCIEKEYEVFAITRKSFSKWYYLKLEDVKIDVEFFKNRYQPIYSKKDKSKLIKNLEYDYIFFPIVIFNKNKQYEDDETKSINRLLVNDLKSKKVGYAYSIQCINNSSYVDGTEEKISSIITNDYIID